MDIDRPFLFINGLFVPSSGGERIELLEAATELPLGMSASATKADLDRAVAAARAAFPSWRGLGAEQRGPLLARFADALRSRGQQTAELVSRENGMPIGLSRMANGRTPAAISLTTRRWHPRLRRRRFVPTRSGTPSCAASRSA
jgi:aldehyde dehydrogenase (NAD+)